MRRQDWVRGHPQSPYIPDAGLHPEYTLEAGSARP